MRENLIPLPQTRTTRATGEHHAGAESAAGQTPQDAVDLPGAVLVPEIVRGAASVRRNQLAVLARPTSVL